MTTIKELYCIAGNPNLSHWKTTKLFSISEASLLVSAIEPIEYENSNNELPDNSYIISELKGRKPTNWQHAILLMRSIVEAICTQELKSPLIKLMRANDYGYYNITIEQARVSIDEMSEISYIETRIHRDEWFKWLEKNGYLRQPHVENKIITINEKPLNNDPVLLLTQTTYMTPALEAIHGVVNHWWKDFNPENNDSLPQQKHIKAWIAENYPEMNTDYMQTAIDKICRHPSAKKGGIRKLNL